MFKNVLKPMFKHKFTKKKKQRFRKNKFIYSVRFIYPKNKFTY